VNDHLEALGVTPSLFTRARGNLERDGMSPEAFTAYLLSISHPILNRLPSMPTGKDNVTYVRSQVSLPKTMQAVINKGVKASMANFVPAKFGITSRRALFKIPLSMLTGRLATQAATFLMEQQRSFSQSLSDDVANVLFYGGASDIPIDFEATRGLDEYFTGPSQDVVGKRQINLSGTNVGKQTRVYMIYYGPQGGVEIQYPQMGSLGMMKSVDDTTLHSDPVNDPTAFDKYHLEYYDQAIGLCMKNPHGVALLDNVDREDLKTGAFSARELGKALIRMQTALSENIQDWGPGNTTIFCSFDFLGALKLEFYDSTFGAGGRMSETNRTPMVMNFGGIDIVREPAIGAMNRAINK